MKNLFFKLILALTMLFALLPGTVFAETITGINHKGDVSWVFTDDGTLTFSGTGTISNAGSGSSGSSSDFWSIDIDEENVKTVIINYGITGIDGFAFSGCSNLENITIPNSVNSIGPVAFSGCSSLESITIPNSVNSLGESIFSYCDKLANVIIPDSVTNIGEFAFYYCSSLEQITIPNSVTNIGESAFENCESLTNISIPNSVTIIEDSALHGCSSLKSITIPNSVISIGKEAFRSCIALTDVYYTGTQSEWDKIAIDNNYNRYLTNATIHFSSKSNNNSGVSSTSTGISIMLNGNPLSFSQAPYMANNTTMVPMRVIFEALGADVNYDSASQKITATKGDTVIELVLGQKTAKKNGESITLDAAAVTKNGNTMVPLRFVAEALQAQVNWDDATQTVSIVLE